MKFNKIKKKSFVKNKGKIIIILVFLFSTFISLFFYTITQNNIQYLSIHELSCLISYNETLKTNQLEMGRINTILDQKFQSICKNAKVIDFEFKNECYYDDFTHYIESKVLLGKKLELLGNKDILFLLNKTYHEHKFEFSNKTELHAKDNRWNHIIMAMNSLDMLNNSEKNFWINTYSNLKLNENEQKFPQAWNRIWMFKIFGINDIKTLAENFSLNFFYVNRTVCNYKPNVDDLRNGNVFNEPDSSMFVKYLLIKKFCNFTINKEDNSYLLNVTPMKFDDPCAEYNKELLIRYLEIST